MSDASHRGSSEVDPWNRLVMLIDSNLDMSIRNQRLLLELWGAGIRDAKLRDDGEQQWACYRAVLLTMVVESCNQGPFTPTLSPDDVVDMLLAILAGAMVPRVFRATSPVPDHFRTALLHQIAQMLGRA